MSDFEKKSILILGNGYGQKLSPEAEQMMAEILKDRSEPAQTPKESSREQVVIDNFVKTQERSFDLLERMLKPIEPEPAHARKLRWVTLIIWTTFLAVTTIILMHLIYTNNRFEYVAGLFFGMVGQYIGLYRIIAKFAYSNYHVENYDKMITLLTTINTAQDNFDKTENDE